MLGGRSAAWPLRVALASIAVAAIGGFALGDAVKPVEVRLGDVRATVDGGMLTVTAEVLPGSQDGARYSLWYELTPAGADSPAFTSDAVSDATRGRAPNPVALTHSLDVLPGEYRLDVWLHLRRRDEVVEAGHHTLDLDLRDHTPRLLRTRPPAELGIAPTSTITASAAPFGPVRLTGTIVLYNTASTPRAATVAVGLMNSRTSGDRWAESFEVVVAGNGTATVEVEEALAAWPGTYRPAIEVRSGSTVTDQATAAGAVVVEPVPGIDRSRLPDGDVMIAAAAAPSQWRDGEARTLAVTVANLSGEPRTVRVLPVVASAGTSAPWASSRISCRHDPTELAPYERREVPVHCVLASPPGAVQLTYWLHERHPDQPDGETHSDTVRAAAPLAVSQAARVRHLVERALGAVVVESLDAPTAATTGRMLGATATVRNTTDQSLEIAAWWVLDTAAIASSPDANTHHASVGDRRTIHLAPGERREVWLGGTVAAAPGDYELAAAVHTRTGTSYPWQHGDQGWSPHRVGIEAP